MTDDNGASPKYLLPSSGDNAAIATRRLERGEIVTIDGEAVRLREVVLQGHRICVRPIARDEAILSWGLPFGTALEDIRPGDYLCNAKARDVLRYRNPEDYGPSLRANFEDRDTVVERILPEAPEFGTNVADIQDGITFEGFDRGAARGWGTRNYLAVIGVTSRSRSVVLEAVRRLQPDHPAIDGFDGVVPIIHTEGGGSETASDHERLLRTLAGFAANPNVGAALFVNDSRSQLLNDEIQALAARRGARNVFYYTVDCVSQLGPVVAKAAALAAELTGTRRRPAPLSGLRLGLQCGGSDAFSGVTANQVLGKAVHSVIRRGGTANLAETDELIGAEQHVLQRVAGQGVFNSFLEMQQRFKDYAAAHGQTAEGNVSGGNLYRGLYNITLKSIGAARKKDPATYIDYTIEYGAPMDRPGYCFMDSPGNDLESIAGQVAAGANLILFTTGNGSITNFPFVPTLKIVTTRERFRLLETDMDFDAGLVLEGETMEAAGQRLFDLMVSTAAGVRSKGERTGQYQTQIWRSAFYPKPDLQEPHFDGQPLLPAANDTRIRNRLAEAPRVSLILPTSLCSGQVAEQIAGRLNEAGSQDRVVAVPHTEGCGVSGGNSERLFRDTMIGYATHPLIARCVFLEHGCEKTHNDYFRAALRDSGVDDAGFEWASIQLEGGINAVGRHVEAAILDTPARAVPDRPVLIGIASERPSGKVDGLVRELLAAGIGVVFADKDPAIKLLEIPQAWPTLAYAQRPERAGLHIMDCSSTDWLEIATGLGAAGCRCLLVFAESHPRQPHRFIPTLQIGPANQSGFDLQPNEPLLPRLLATLAGDYRPKVQPAPNVGFQISRGRFGVSL
ncbi:UxaA family hydrolase [Paracoccus versutus]|uniref:UxaA family hydrolase n=1 Tax=Paracoccus versutus TaxID=34007 RepID=UPI001FB69659|nr:UxaA family hydrolase [Paracoccus versutus]MCJ1901400.1 UxaA family hydrolase [Paracoccus versutus]